MGYFVELCVSQQHAPKKKSHSKPLYLLVKQEKIIQIFCLNFLAADSQKNVESVRQF